MLIFSCYSVSFPVSWILILQLPFVNRENLFEEMLQEPDEIAMKRKRTRETLRVLQQAFRVSFSELLVTEGIEREQRERKQ